MSSFFYQTLSQIVLLKSVRFFKEQDAAYFEQRCKNLPHTDYSEALKSWHLTASGIYHQWSICFSPMLGMGSIANTTWSLTTISSKCQDFNGSCSTCNMNLELKMFKKFKFWTICLFCPVSFIFTGFTS